MKHQHCDCLIAIAEGKSCQTRANASEEWHDLRYPAAIFTHPHLEFRVKPCEIRARVGVFSIFDVKQLIVVNEDHVEQSEKDPSFLEWLPDWIEYNSSTT